MSISDIINWFITYSTSKMPGKGRGRPQSAWWSHFEMVEGDIFKDVDIYMIFLLLGNFRLVRCLHCNKLVRRGKDGCTSREASNSGMAAHEVQACWPSYRGGSFFLTNWIELLFISYFRSRGELKRPRMDPISQLITRMRLCVAASPCSSWGQKLTDRPGRNW